MLDRAVRNYYLYPEAFLQFGLSGPPDSLPGFFKFGEEITCYGRTSNGARGTTSRTKSYDASQQVEIVHSEVRLPFDPSEVIDNLRLEVYARGGLSEIPGFFKQAYYYLRPFMNLTARSQVQRFHNRNWRKRTFPAWPVDTTVENLCEKLLLLSMEANGIEEVPFVWFWPDGATGCMVMTHDVETKAGRDFCGRLMDLDDSFGVKASFQVVPEGRYEVTPEFVASIRERRFEYGIQDLNHDGRLYDSEEQFAHRAKAINDHAARYGAKGFRAGVLYRRPEWFEKLNFSFDMSIPNVAHLDPQRGGCCTVMPYFIGDVLEIPVTTIQDYTLHHLLNETSLTLWQRQIELILAKNGLVSFIVHPDYLMNASAQAVYIELLDYLSDLRVKRRLWMPLPSDIDSWWRERANLSVQRTGNSWQVAGDKTGRATLAFARNIAGRLVFDVPANEFAQ